MPTFRNGAQIRMQVPDSIAAAFTVVQRAPTLTLAPVPGPQGKQGEPGPPGIPPPYLTNGQPRFNGLGPPTLILGAQPDDLYLDTLTGDLYRLE